MVLGFKDLEELGIRDQGLGCGVKGHVRVRVDV